MPKGASRKQPDSAIGLDADRLGLVAATLLGTVVMGVALLRGADVLEGLVRFGFTFAGVYAAMFFFASRVRRIILTEMAEESLSSEATEDETAAEPDEGV